MSDVDEESQRKLLEMNGWIPLDLLGEGGGARVFKVISLHAVQRVAVPLLTATVSDRQASFEQAKSLAQMIVEFTDGTQIVLAAGKVAKDPTFRTKREIEILKQIDHPHLIKPIVIDQSPEPRWYVMPLMRRGTLADNADRFEGQFVVVLRGMIQVAGALAAMHERRGVHRDVKPGNIFVGDNGDWVLGDPGVAYLPDGADETRTRAVSKDWFPRWFEDEFGHTPRVDIYMLAATAIFLLTGKKPLDPSYLRPDRVHLPTMFAGARGAQEMQDLLCGLFVSDAATIKATDGRSLIALASELLTRLDVDDATQARQAELATLRAQLTEPRLVYSFGRSGAGTDGGDHAGLQMVPVYVPTNARQLRIWIGVDARAPEAGFKLELWNSNADQQWFESPMLKRGVGAEVVVPKDAAGTWCRITLRGHTGFGTTLITAVAVHAVFT